MTKYLKYSDAERSTSRIKLQVPNFEYLMMKASQHGFHTTRYDIIKKAAIYLLGCHMLRSVQIIQDGLGCLEGYFSQHKLPDKPFRWLDLHPEEFETGRRQNLFWLDILEKFVTDDCLDRKKLYNDMEVLQHYIRKLFRAYIFSKQDIINEELENMIDYLSKLEQMKDEFDDSKKLLETVTDKFFESTFANHGSKARVLPLRTQLDDLMVHSTIEHRCLVGVCKARIEEEELAANKMAHLLQEQIDNYNTKIRNEQLAHMHSISVYLSLCDQYRFDLYMMYEKYDKMYNLQDTKLKKNMKSINFMKEQTLFYEDIIKSYHKRLVEFKLEDEAKAEALRRKEEADKEKEVQRLRMEKLKLAAKKSMKLNPDILRNNKKSIKNIKITKRKKQTKAN